MKYLQIPKHQSQLRLFPVVQINVCPGFAVVVLGKADIEPCCFYQLHNEYRGGCHCISYRRLFSPKNNTIGSATDLPPFNGLVIKNDGQIKIEGPDRATQCSSSFLILVFMEVCGSRAETKLNCN